MKSYTDLEQSKKLVGFLPIESADMRYGYIAPYEFSDRMYEGGYDNVPYPKDFLEKNPNFSENDYDDSLPCWSLAALLNVLPDTITSNDGIAFKLNIKKNIIEYSNPSLYLIYKSVKSDNPIDACYEMIIKIKEKGLL